MAVIVRRMSAVLGAAIGLSACAASPPLERFPVEVTIETAVDGEPVRIVKRTECFQKILPRPIRYRGPTWHLQTRQFRHQLQSKLWFIVEVANPCPQLPETVDFFGKRAYPFAAILDDLDLPRVSEHYSSINGFYASRVSKSARVDLENFRIRYRRGGEGEPAQRFTNPAELSGRSKLSIVGGALNGGATSPRYENPRLSVQGRLWVIPHSLWSKREFFVRRITPQAGVTRVSLSADEHREFLRFRNEIMASAISVARGIVIDREPGTQFQFVPLRPDTSNTWRPNWRRASIAIQYALGRQCSRNSSPTTIIQCIKGDEWLDKQIIIYKNKEIKTGLENLYYDYISKNIIFADKFDILRFYD